MTIGERIKFVRKTCKRADGKSLTLEQFGEKFGLGRSAMSAIETGTRGVTDQTIISICREFGVSPEWLRDGTGEPFVKQPRDQEILSFCQKTMNQPPTAVQRRILGILARLNADEWEQIAEMVQRLVSEDE